MPPIRISTFGGIAPKVDPRLLPDNAAQTAENCDLQRGHIRPWKAPLVVEPLSVSGAKTIFPYRGSWLQWSGVVNVVKAPLEDDIYERIIYTGDGAPKVRGLVSGVETIVPLGVPRPSAALTVAVQAKTAVTWTRTWQYFYEEPDGTQKDAGTLSATEVTPGREYTVTAVPTRSTATGNAKLIVFFDAYKANGVLIGRVYPSISKQAGNSDLYINGAQVTLRQTTTASLVTLNINYNVSATTRTYTVKVKNKRKKVTETNYEDQWDLVSLYYTQERTWTYTFVNHWGEEGPPADPSAVTAMDPSQDAVLSGFETAVAGRPDIVKIRVYRTVTGDAGNEFAYVATFNIGPATYTDSADDEDTNEIMPSLIWYAPPADLAGLVELPGEFLAGFVGKTVQFSEPGFPHAWPSAYTITVGDDIVGLGVSGNNLVVATTGKPKLISVPEPSGASIIEIPSPQSCTSMRGIAQIGGAVFYPSPDGLVMMTGATAVVVTKPIFTKSQWLDLDPDNMHAAVYDDRLFLFSPSATIILSFGDSTTVTTTDQRASAAFYDETADALYLAQDTLLTQWDAGTSDLQFTWKSREFTVARPIDPAVGRITADGFPVVLRCYTPSGLAITKSVGSDTAFRMPPARPDKFWSFQVSGSDIVREIVISGAMADL